MDRILYHHSRGPRFHDFLEHKDQNKYTREQKRAKIPITKDFITKFLFTPLSSWFTYSPPLSPPTTKKKQKGKRGNCCVIWHCNSHNNLNSSGRGSVYSFMWVTTLGLGENIAHKRGGRFRMNSTHLFWLDHILLGYYQPVKQQSFHPPSMWGHVSWALEIVLLSCSKYCRFL